MMNLEMINNDLMKSFNSMLDGIIPNGMKTDIMENDKEYVLEVEVPGVNKENIEISYMDDELTISVKSDNSDTKANYIAKERSSYSLSRSYYLENADDNNIKAKLDNGILTVVLAKLEAKANPKRIVNIE